MTKKTTRRNFIMTSVAVTGGIVGGAAMNKQTQTKVASVEIPTTSTIPERVLGKTGVKVPLLGLGGAGRTPVDKSGKEKEAVAIIETALSLGIRYFDTAASYGASEEHFGKVLPAYRNDIFLATKTGRRDRDGAWRELERSLKRLNTDYLDSWQLHHVSFMETLDQIFGNQGVIKAMEEAKEQGIVKFSGITGHHEPDVIAEGLRRYPFDTTLVSINAADKHHPRPFAPAVLPVAQQKNVGVIGMKIPAYGKLLQPGVLNMQEAMGYVLSLAGVHCCIIATESVEMLQSNVRVAQQFQQLTQQDMGAIEQKTASVWQENTFFRAWT
ncbi:aldo/keto reductase [Hydrocoleum sp. CS-953]|uniref:aldo/keto reductase n=1 Tax=Hydrocoleum sp. CS-953 TaxID=1671698 RepID=UPI000B9AD2D6|nr:aldo/keto reductase [Hydrocoleum sp. CS-953]OZH51683.1 aldo/keto reductase [Hydrocoleum sp. CS-953]